MSTTSDAQVGPVSGGGVETGTSRVKRGMAQMLKGVWSWMWSPRIRRRLQRMRGRF
jgi:hypothetical protein